MLSIPGLDELTYSGLMMQNLADIGSGNGLVPQAITWPNTDLSKVFCGIHIREILQEILQISLHDIWLKMIESRL